MSLLTYLAGAFAGLLARDAAPPAAPPPPKQPEFNARAMYDALMSLGVLGGEQAQRTPFELYTTRPVAHADIKRMFAPAQPLPGTLPEGVTPMAMDDINNPMVNYGSTSGLTEGMVWLGWPYLAELAQRTEYRRISETIAKDMTRRWFRLQATGNDDKTDRITQLQDAIKKHKLQEKFTSLALLDGFFGRSHLYIDTGITDDRAQLKLPLPLDPRMITKGSLKALRVVEPMWCYPNMFNAGDPLKENFYLPQTWYVSAKEVHRSRLLPFISRPMTDMLKPAYSFGGLSLSQMAKPYVDNWLRTRQSVSDLIHSFSTPVLQTNMGSVLNAGASEMLKLRAALFNYLRDNNNLMILDKTTEDFKNVATPLGSLDHLQAQSQEHMASAVGIPLVVLLGITPSGLNASSEGELQVWAQFIHASQTSFYDANLIIILQILMLDLWGEIDPAITHEWEPLKELTESEEAAAAKSEADIDAVYVDAGVLSPEEIRQKLSSEPDSPYQGLDLTAPPPPPPQAEGDPLAGGGGASLMNGGGDPGDAPGGAGQPAGGSPAPVPSGPGKIGTAGSPKPPDPNAGSRDADNVDENGLAPGESHTRIVPQDKSAVIHVHFGPTDRGQIRLGADQMPTRDHVQTLIDGLQDLLKYENWWKGTAADADFVESDHPRAPDGKFGSGGGGGGAPAPRRADHVMAKRTADGKGFTGLPPHIAKMRIPPAWSDVSYNPNPKAALQVLGKDAAGRVQSIYSDEHHMKQAAAKFARIKELSRKFDSIKRQNDTALASDDPRKRAAAEVMALIMHTGMRPGSEEDTGARHQGYGATTLEGRHVVEDAKGNVSLTFVPGKKHGETITMPVTDPAVAKMLRQRKRKAGADGQLFPEVGNNGLLEHVHSFDGGGFKTKDFRTLIGTRTAMDEVAKAAAPTDAKSYKKSVMEVAKKVSAKLGNTPTVALQSYISPTVFAAWQHANG